jgi:hypothetical protein
LARVAGSLCTISTAFSRTVSSSPSGRPSAANSTRTVNLLEKVSMKSNAARPQAGRGVARDVADRLGQAFEVALHEGVLDQPAQAVVARRIGGAQRGAGAAGQFGHQVALCRRVGLPVLPGTDDVGVARQDPRVGLGAPEAGVLVAQRAVGGNGSASIAGA